MPESAISALVSQGGFAVLAAFLGWLGYQQNKSAQGLVREVMELLKTASATQATHTASVASLTMEVVELRRELHATRDMVRAWQEDHAP